jgi:hypothetical protein
MRAAPILLGIAIILLVAIIVLGPAIEAAVAELLEPGFGR